MENGIHSSVRTNHDRDSWTNGVNGGAVKHEISDKGKNLVAHDMTNGSSGAVMDVDSEPRGALAMAVQSSMDDLPDEIQRITADILPLGLILSRLAQFSHSTLMDQIDKLASKPLPQNMANGGASYQFTGAEDTSQESLDKKVFLLKTLQDLHTRWVKALVITEWSKKAEKVSRLIDIRAHLATKLGQFEQVFWDLITVKRELQWAKVPSPDLKTALEVLSTGEVSWMPDLGYLEPPALTVEEKETWIDNINTVLSVRLTLDEHEKIPLAFRDYTINSGRVTFRVEGEFEVDLTIGDEDPQKQFWFIDFRFLFNPAPAELSEPLRMGLEAKVNLILSTDGLVGCYKFLHEFVLTQKITEFCRQAVELSRGRWIDTLSVERLNRAMAIQYWVNRPHSQGSKSWIILGVNANNGPDGLPDPKRPSCLSLRWFRDNKEVKDCDIGFDVKSISTEDLLTTVVARHIEYLLNTIYSKLLIKPRFAQRQAELSLEISREEPSDSALSMQLFDQENITVKVDGMTGTFSMLPQKPRILDGQRKLNSSPNPVEEGPTLLEQLRCWYTMTDLSSRARSIGWTVVGSRGPITTDELKPMVQSGSQSREPFQTLWLRKNGWSPLWFIIMTMSLGGDQWWLVELSPQKPTAQPGSQPGLHSAQQGLRMKLFTKIPMAPNQMTLSDDFFQTLTVYVSGMISQITDLRELHSKKMGYTTRAMASSSLPRQIKMPTIFVRLSDMLQPENGRVSAPWAKEYVPIVFRGLQGPDDQDGSDNVMVPARRDARIKVIAEARLAVANNAKFRHLKGSMDHDVAFDSRTGQFVLRVRADMGTPVVDLLGQRIRSLERLVDFVEAIRVAGTNVVAQSVTLREVVFTYQNTPEAAPTLANAPQRPSQAWRVRVDLASSKGIDISLEMGNPHEAVIDYLKQAANSASFPMLPSWLVTTLPMFRGLRHIENTWDALSAKSNAKFEVFHKALNWATLHFVLPGKTERAVSFDIKALTRKGKAQWCITRSDPPRATNDMIDDILAQKVWSFQGNGIKGLMTSAAADPNTGIEKLLEMINAAVSSILRAPPQQQNQNAPEAAMGIIPPHPQQTPPQQPQQPPQVLHQSLAQSSQARAQAQARAQQAIARQHQQQQQSQVHQRGGGMPNNSAPAVITID
ncbi:hypothetical protein OQA88_3775 [Cercophora sp. LCS_1]